MAQTNSHLFSSQFFIAVWVGLSFSVLLVALGPTHVYLQSASSLVEVCLIYRTLAGIACLVLFGLSSLVDWHSLVYTAAGQVSRVSGNVQGLLSPGFRTGTPLLPLSFISQNRSQVQPRSEGRANWLHLLMGRAAKPHWTGREYGEEWGIVVVCAIYYRKDR